MRTSPRNVRRALLRGVSDKLAVYGANVELARRQHDSYAAALHETGVEITMLDADPELADCCFIEDAAIIDGDRALLTRMGFESRRPETDALREALTGFEIVEMEAPATLDGGDVLRIDDKVFVGVGRRTNTAGFETLREFLQTDCHPLKFHDCLHLKTACTQVAPGTVVYDPDCIDAPAGFDAIEARDANVLLSNEVCLVSSPGTERTLQARGIDARYLDISEFRKADGCLTCLALLLP